MYKMTLGDTDSDFVNTDFYSDEDALLRGLTELLIERSDDCDDEILKKSISIIRGQKWKKMVDFFNYELAIVEDGDCCEVEFVGKNKNKPCYGNHTWEQLDKKIKKLESLIK